MRESPKHCKKEEDEVDKQKFCERESNMFFIFKEICFVFAIAFTAYASVLNSQPKIRKSPTAAPFFWKQSIVEDFYKGDLHLLMKKVSHSHLSVVMFYAPWDADSIAVRDAFEDAALFYEPEVYFASVNCWQPGSECKTTFKNIPRFPQLVAYMGPHHAVEYRGPLQADHIIKFIYSLLHPLVRVNSISEIYKLRFNHDAVLVGYLSLSGCSGSKNYNTLFKTAWRLAGTDHVRRTAFAVATHDRFIPNGLSSPSFVLYLWNKEIVYEGELKVDSLMKWLTNESDKNQLIIRQALQENNAKLPLYVTVFYRTHPLYPHSIIERMIKKIAMNFNVCRDLDNDASDLSFYNHLFDGTDVYSLYEQDADSRVNKLVDECFKKRKTTYKVKTCTSTVVWSNDSCYHQTCDSSSYSILKIPESYSDWYRRLKCDLLDRGLDYYVGGENPIKMSRQSGGSSGTGLGDINACQINSTVIFSLLDLNDQPQLALTLGLVKSPSVFIFNSQEVINSNATEESIYKGISSFIKGRVDRHTRKTQSTPQKIHLFNELSSYNFSPTVFNNSMNVVVLYYSKHCGSCGMMSQSLLRLAHMVKDVETLLFTRIDGEKNDLPFYLQVHSYPTLIIFPAKRKAESRVFSSKVPWTVENLKQFIVSNLGIKDKVLTLLAACSVWSNNPSANSDGELCISKVRVSTLELISKTLRNWRLELPRFGKSLETLRFLKMAYLKLARVTDIKQLLRYFLSEFH